MVSDQLCDASGHPAQVKQEELVTRPRFREMVEFLQYLFYENETLVQLVQEKVVKIDM